MKRIVRIVVVSVLLLAAIVAGGSLYMLSYSLRPDATMRAKNASSYEYMYGEYPFLRPWVDSLERTGALRDTVILGSEGERLHAIYAAAPRPTDRTAVIVHGYTDNAVRMLMIGYLYNRDLGCNILLPDLYYHGQSEGRAIRMGWKDRFDVLRWMDIANDIFGGDTRMVVHGISMGAATTMMVSGEEQQPYVKCFVEDCGYTSVRDQFSKELKEQFGLPAFPLLDAASWLCGLKYGWTFGEASSLEQVKKSRLPMLFIHGGKDAFVPFAMLDEVYAAARCPKATPTITCRRGWSIRFTGPSPATRNCGWCRERRMPIRTATTGRSTRAASGSSWVGISAAGRSELSRPRCGNV